MREALRSSGDPCRKHADLYRAPPPPIGGGGGRGGRGGRGGAWDVEPETINVIRSHPDVADALRRVLAAWHARADEWRVAWAGHALARARGLTRALGRPGPVTPLQLRRQALRLVRLVKP